MYVQYCGLQSTHETGAPVGGKTIFPGRLSIRGWALLYRLRTLPVTGAGYQALQNRYRRAELGSKEQDFRLKLVDT